MDERKNTRMRLKKDAWMRHSKGLCMNGLALLLLCLLGGLSACSKDKEPDRKMLKGDVAVYVNLMATRSGDPGSSHGEDEMQWTNLRIYMLYDNNRMVEHTLTRTQYEEMTDKVIMLRVPVGRAQAYAVAYTGNVSIKPCSTVEQVKNLTTGDMTTPGITKTDWVNLFSGKSAEWVEVTPEARGRTSVTLKRLVAKIDVQYDVQEGLDGNYENITMNEIIFHGPKEGYFFPEDATGLSFPAEVVATSVCNDPVSDRNGRQYFYTFPTKADVKHQFEFTLNYEPKAGAADAIKGEKTYRFAFSQSPEATQWYKVNLTVKGNAITDTNLVLMPTTQP